MNTLIHQRVESARNGANPFVICKVPSGWAVMGDHQFIHGYCLLLPDPVVDNLNALEFDQRAAFLVDMSRIGDALLAQTDSHRINYEILGNTDAALHAHIFPRYMSEPEQYRKGPIWRYSKEELSSVKYSAEIHAELQQGLAEHIESQL